jgi:rhodanese-related sulfurtransferase
MKYLFFLTVLLIFTNCANEPTNEITPEQLLLDLTDNERYISVDEVADRMINKDPSLLLVDVRNHETFDAFTLPGAINIPLENLLSSENSDLIDCERFTVVFFSNDDLHAEQAWLLSRRTGCKSNHIMRGGLNEWTTTILDPEKPDDLATAEEWELYRFRRAVCQYFIGGSEQLEPEEFPELIRYVQPKKTIVPKKKKAKEEEEGC